MRAALIRSHGQPPGYQDHPVPRRGTGQALIRVTAAPVCPLDLLCASGTSYFGKPPLPYAPGAQGVGIVEEAGTLPAGQRVWFSCDAGMKPGDGAMAELCVAEESSILPLPGHVADDLVAALGLSAIAAWTALTLRGGLRPGEHVLVLGASGTVGQVGVQAARLLGAGRVTAGCRDAHGRARAAELGADAVADLAADDADTLTARLAEAAGGRVDLVLDPVWGMPAEAALRITVAARPAGQPRLVGGPAGRPGICHAAQRHALGSRLHQQRAQPRAEGGGAGRDPAARHGRAPHGRPRDAAPGQSRGRLVAVREAAVPAPRPDPVRTRRASEQGSAKPPRCCRRCRKCPRGTVCHLRSGPTRRLWLASGRRAGASCHQHGDGSGDSEGCRAPRAPATATLVVHGGLLNSWDGT